MVFGIKCIFNLIFSTYDGVIPIISREASVYVDELRAREEEFSYWEKKLTSHLDRF